MDNGRLEQYLTTIDAGLQTLPAARRAEELREIRQHLEALVAGHMARGAAEADAVEAAIRQFGHAEKIGRGLEAAWERRRAPRLWPHLLTYVCMVAVIFALFATANDKPTDFPYEFADKLLLSMALAAGVVTIHVIQYLRTRSANYRA